MIFGQHRSDNTQFYHRDVPSVCFSDATAVCYHTNEEIVEGVDFMKLAD